jgi:hypothetical protein
MSNDQRRQYWREVIERHEASGQSIVGFCAQQRLSPSVFHAWKRRFRQSRRVIRRKAAKEALIPVEIVSDPADGMGNLEVQWPDGVVLRVQGCDMQTISTVIATVSASSTRRMR